MSDAREDNSRGWPSAEELRWASLAAAAVMLLTCLPYLYGLLILPAGHYYSGLLTNPDEHNVYLAYMRQAHDGAFFLIDPFTSEVQSGHVVNLYFVPLGVFGRVVRLPLPVVYHLARVVSGWLLLMAVYCMAAQVLTSVAGRRLALLLTAVASGLGWLFPAAPGRPHPIDYGPGLVMPEAITFLSLLLNPLFCFSVFLMVVVLGLGAHAFTSGSVRSGVIAGAAALVLGNIHTYNLIPVSGVLTVYLVGLLVGRAVGGRSLLIAFLIAAIAAPSLLYQVWLIRGGEITLAVKAVETPVPSPNPVFLALGLGVPLGLALAGLGRAVRRDAVHMERLLAVWMVLGFALVYAPVPFQRKLAEGLHIPVCLLAVLAAEWLWLHVNSRLRLATAATLLIIVSPSNALFVADAARDLQTNNRAYLGNLMPPLYLRDDQHAALRALSAEGSRADVLLCNSFLGSYAPWVAGTRVYVGHWAETLHFRQKQRDLARFLEAGTSDASREAFCRREGITHVLRDRSVYDELYYHPPEGDPGPGFQPETSAWLSLVFERDRVAVYRVRTQD